MNWKVYTLISEIIDGPHYIDNEDYKERKI